MLPSSKRLKIEKLLHLDWNESSCFFDRFCIVHHSDVDIDILCGMGLGSCCDQCSGVDGDDWRHFIAAGHLVAVACDTGRITRRFLRRQIAGHDRFVLIFDLLLEPIKPVRCMA